MSQTAFFDESGGESQIAPSEGDGEGSSARFLTLNDVEVPEGFETMFEALGDWRRDVSSTELRAANEGK